MGKATRWLKGLFGMKNATKNITPVEVIRMRSYSPQANEQAIAVAAATAAAAEAAVAAAHAAAEVVRLSTRDRNQCNTNGMFYWAAIRIQTTFRGHLVS